MKVHFLDLLINKIVNLINTENLSVIDYIICVEKCNGKVNIIE